MVTRKHASRARHEARRPASRRPAPAGSVDGKAAAGPWRALETALGAFGRRLPGIGADLKCLAAVQVDRARLGWAQAVSRLAAGILLLVVGATVSATAAALLVVGVAGGVAGLLGVEVWLANAVTGATVLAAPVAWWNWREHRAAGRRMQRWRGRYEPSTEARREAPLVPGTARTPDHAE